MNSACWIETSTTALEHISQFIAWAGSTANGVYDSHPGSNYNRMYR